MESFASCLTVYPTLSQFQAADYDSIEDETLYDFNEIYSSGMVSLLNKSNAIYQLLGQPMFLLALLALCVLTVRVIHGLFHGDTKDLELWILTCGILLSAVLLRFGCGLFTAWFPKTCKSSSTASIPVASTFCCRCSNIWRLLLLPPACNRYGNNIFKIFVILIRKRRNNLWKI